MNVVYASNDNYARHLGTSLYSLLDHNREMEEIAIYILSVGMCKEYKERLASIAGAFGRRLYVTEMGEVEQRFSCRVDTGGFDISTLSRLFIGEILPPDARRALYLDCDTVVVDSLEKLWNVDLKGRMLGAVMEPTIYTRVKEDLGLTGAQPYYNAGVLLIDLDIWREKEAQKRIVEFYVRHGGQLFACDQDAINGALKGEIKTLNPRYNFFTNYKYFHYRDLVRMSPSYGVIPEMVFKQAARHPALLHFMGDERPWVAGNLNHYRKVYDEYLSLTPWKGAKREGGKRVYMLIYHAMDYLTYLCPSARMAISRRFGMQVINNRKK